MDGPWASSAWHSRWSEIGLTALCSVLFTAEVCAKHPFKRQIHTTHAGADGRVKGCFAYASAVNGSLYRALISISAPRLCHADEAYKAETAFHGCHCPGDMAARIR